MAKPKKRSSKAKVKSLPTSRSKSKRVKGGIIVQSPELMNPMTPKALIYFAAQPPGGTQIR